MNNTSLYLKGFRYYLRLDRNGQPVLGSLIARKRKPHGNFIDITAGIAFCCNAELGQGLPLNQDDNPSTTSTTTIAPTTSTTTIAPPPPPPDNDFPDDEDDEDN